MIRMSRWRYGISFISGFLGSAMIFLYSLLMRTYASVAPPHVEPYANLARTIALLGSIATFTSLMSPKLGSGLMLAVAVAAVPWTLAFNYASGWALDRDLLWMLATWSLPFTIGGLVIWPSGGRSEVTEEPSEHRQDEA